MGKVGHLGRDLPDHLPSVVQEEEDAVPLLCLGEGHTTPIQVDIQVNGVPVTMEADTEAVVPVMSQQQEEVVAHGTDATLTDLLMYVHSSAWSVQVVGTLPVQVMYREQGQGLSVTGHCTRHWTSLAWKGVACTHVHQL